MNETNKIIDPFFVNSIAKSGTHLIRPLLEGVPELKHQNFIYPGHIYQLQEHKQVLSRMSANQFANGHLFHSEEYVKLFEDLNMKQVFLYRDPRDIVVSYAHFFMKFPNHPYYQFFTENNMTVQSRCKLIINGNEILRRPNINDWYHRFLPWKNEPNVLPVKYENLVASPELQKQELRRILQFVGVNRKSSLQIEGLLRRMQNHVDPTKSPTYRKGQSGNWRQEFDEEVKNQFKRVAGQLLIELGYERDLNW
ncbi:sulfotransferase domain-containing protein [Pseudalkalibacillus sp. Hm43]|uniref:sulfotransferase domain-containing protein n=1 Tax=Pseudalkalibacillus sp. Hm43 TaxID=3450742 RepID=UPI003F42C615